jgi:hypothetical protein
MFEFAGVSFEGKETINQVQVPVKAINKIIKSEMILIVKGKKEVDPNSINFTTDGFLRDSTIHCEGCEITEIQPTPLVVFPFIDKNYGESIYFRDIRCPNCKKKDLRLDAHCVKDLRKQTETHVECMNCICVAKATVPPLKITKKTPWQYWW